MAEKLLNPKKVFKEKRSIKGELLKALENNTPLGATQLARLVGVSIYRVRKYCKTHHIDLNDYTKEALELKHKKTKPQADSPSTPAAKKRAQRAKKIIIEAQTDNKIHLRPANTNKISLD